MKLHHAHLGNHGRAAKTAKGPRYQVRWTIDPQDGRTPFSRKRTTFRTKAEASQYLELLRKAELRVGLWHFDRDGFPTDHDETTLSCLAAVESYMAFRWDDWSPSQRQKVRGRLLEFIALTVSRPGDRLALMSALNSQRADRHHQREEPTSRPEWAARWLREYAFLPTVAAADDQRLVAGHEWLMQQTTDITVLLTDTVMLPLRKHYVVGRSDGTARTYWEGTMVPFFKWLVDTRKLSHNPTAGLKKIKRDVQAERPDRRNIPDPQELGLLAKYFGDAYGDVWELWVLVGALCALRPGELRGVRCCDFSRDGEGRLWLNVEEQVRNNTKKYSDDGKTSQERTATKSVRRQTPLTRPVPVPTFLALRLTEVFGDRLCSSAEYMFVGPRGAVANPSTVGDRWKRAVVALFAENPHLRHITPHSLRHAGMTYWFAAGNDQKIIQRWGGWKSLKEMLDTYRGVIDSLVSAELDNLDAFHDEWNAE